MYYPVPRLYLFANLMSWIAQFAAAYVWYRVGWAAALAYLVIPFVLAQVIETAELFLFRFRTAVMALVCTPIGIVGFAVLIWSLVAL